MIHWRLTADMWVSFGSCWQLIQVAFLIYFLGCCCGTAIIVGSGLQCMCVIDGVGREGCVLPLCVAKSFFSGRFSNGRKISLSGKQQQQHNPKCWIFISSSSVELPYEG